MNTYRMIENFKNYFPDLAEVTTYKEFFSIVKACEFEHRILRELNNLCSVICNEGVNKVDFSKYAKEIHAKDFTDAVHKKMHHIKTENKLDESYIINYAEKLGKEYEQNLENKTVSDPYSLYSLSVDEDKVIELFKEVFNVKADKKKEILTKLTYLSDATTDEELTALCDACDYNYDTLTEWNKECKLLAQGVIVRSNFAKALTESFYNDDNALIDYTKEYKKSISKPPAKANKPKVSDREL